MKKARKAPKDSKCEAGIGVDYTKNSPMVRMCMKPATVEYQGPHTLQLWPTNLCDEHYKYFSEKDHGQETPAATT